MFCTNVRNQFDKTSDTFLGAQKRIVVNFRFWFRFGKGVNKKGPLGVSYYESVCRPYHKEKTAPRHGLTRTKDPILLLVFREFFSEFVKLFLFHLF